MIEALLSHFKPLIIATAQDGGDAICILMHNASMAPLPSGGVVMETLYACYTCDSLLKSSQVPVRNALK